MRQPRTAAGKRLVAAQNAALERASQERGEQLVWSEAEEAALERAGLTVDRAEDLRKLLASELEAEDPNGNKVVKFSAEIRALDRLVVQLLDRLAPDEVGPSKSKRHQRAAQARWNRAVN